METSFDLVVIGTGSAASTAAHECSSKGWKVAVIDSLPFGGTCPLRGCDPKKVLVEAAKIIDENKRHLNKGITGSSEIQIKWRDLIYFKRTFTEPFPERRETGYIQAGISVFHGYAEFSSRNSILVKPLNNGNNDNKNIVLTGRYTLIATGAKPMDLNIHGSENIITSDQFLELDDDKLPDRIVFVGGGYISFEFAHIAARAGAKRVTILHRGRQPLEHFDPDLVYQLIERSKDIGIDVELCRTVEKVEKIGADKFIVYSSDLSNVTTNSSKTKAGTTNKIEADLVVHGAGRIPNIERLDLPTGGIEYDARKGINVNEYLQSISNPSVYAAGDVANSGGAPLTPVASYEGMIVADNLINGNTHKSKYIGIPSVVFTVPAIATVGMLEKEAKQKGLQFTTRYENTGNWASSQRVGETCSGFKILIENDTDRILGAHILGPHAEEVINIFSLAIRLGISSKDLKDPVLYSYPTNSSDVIYML